MGPREKHEPGVVAYSCNASIQEVERDRRNCDEFKYSLGYTASSRLAKNTAKKAKRWLRD